VTAVHKTLNILTHAIKMLQILVTDNWSSSFRQREEYNHGSEYVMGHWYYSQSTDFSRWYASMAQLLWNK